MFEINIFAAKMHFGEHVWEQVPEIVPFRLTRDIVAGLGCLGVEGTFRQHCERCLETLRKNAEVVTAVVEVFVHDPVFRWSLLPRKKLSTHDVEARRTIDDEDKSTGNDDAKRALIGIRAKLAGQCAEGRSLPLEVAAQVDFLLKYASAPENLAVMYQGWSSWV